MRVFEYVCGRIYTRIHVHTQHTYMYTLCMYAYATCTKSTHTHTDAHLHLRTRVRARAHTQATYGEEELRRGGIVDVAGGKGEISFRLVHHHNIPCTLVDPRPVRLLMCT